jgi:hypothetical protein
MHWFWSVLLMRANPRVEEFSAMVSTAMYEFGFAGIVERTLYVGVAEAAGSISQYTNHLVEFGADIL